MRKRKIEVGTTVCVFFLSWIGSVAKVRGYLYVPFDFCGFVRWLSGNHPCTVPHLVLGFQCASFRQFTLDHNLIHLLYKPPGCELTKRGALESEHQMWDGTWTST